MSLDAERARTQEDVDGVAGYVTGLAGWHRQHQRGCGAEFDRKVERHIGHHTTVDVAAALELDRRVHAGEGRAGEDSRDGITRAQPDGLPAGEVGGHDHQRHW